MPIPTWRKHWEAFEADLQSRLDNGHRTYGDASFERPVIKLIREVKEEIVDQCGWSFIAWVRLDALEKKVLELEERAKANPA